MFRGAVVAAVVPAYREEQMIRRVIETMPELVDHIIVVDDCSPDDTSGAAAAVGDPRLVLIRHEANAGVGGAIITGHRRAIELGADVDVVMAGDAQMDAAYLPTLLEPVVSRGYGFAKANRFFAPDSIRGMPRHRVVGSVLLSIATKMASGYWHLFDPQNGYTAVRTSVLRQMSLDRIAQRYSFENDLLVHLNILQVPAVDVHIPAVYRDEVSSMRLTRVVPELISVLARGFWRRIWYRYVLLSFSPVALLMLLAIPLTTLGVAVSIWLFFVALSSTVATAGTVMLAALPLMLGVQLGVSALLLDIQASPSQPDLLTFHAFERDGS